MEWEGGKRRQEGSLMGSHLNTSCVANLPKQREFCWWLWKHQATSPAHMIVNRKTWQLLQESEDRKTFYATLGAKGKPRRNWELQQTRAGFQETQFSRRTRLLHEQNWTWSNPHRHSMGKTVPPLIEYLEKDNQKNWGYKVDSEHNLHWFPEGLVEFPPQEDILLKKINKQNQWKKGKLWSRFNN